MPDLRHDLGNHDGAGCRNRAAGMWLLLLAVLLVPAATSLYHAARIEAPAPFFELTSTGYENGVQGEPVPFSLADYQGKTVLLDLMAVSCTACRYLTEGLLKPVHAEFGGDPGFVLLSVDTWADPAVAGDPILGYAGTETASALIALQKETKVPWRHALDTDRVWEKYNAISLPRIVVINGDGDIVLDPLDTPTRSEVESAVRASLAGSAVPVPSLQVGLAGLAFVAGAAAVATPCTVGLLPAYLALLLRSGLGPIPVKRREVLRGGVAAAFGIVTVYALLALAFALAGNLLRPALTGAGPYVGSAMVLAGGLAATGKTPAWMMRATPRVDGRRGFYLFGLAFGLAGFGCTGPLFLPLLLAGFAQGTGAGVLLFFLYATAVTLLVLGAAAAVANGLDGRLRALLRHARGIQVAAGCLMVAAGAYLVWYFLNAP